MTLNVNGLSTYFSVALPLSENIYMNFYSLFISVKNFLKIGKNAFIHILKVLELVKKYYSFLFTLFSKNSK